MLFMLGGLSKDDVDDWDGTRHLNATSRCCNYFRYYSKSFGMESVYQP